MYSVRQEHQATQAPPGATYTTGEGGSYRPLLHTYIGPKWDTIVPRPRFGD